MAILENLTTATFTVVAFVLALIALRAWWYSRSHKVLLLTLAFALLFAKGVFFTFNLFTVSGWEERSFIPGLVIDIIALVLFYLAVFRKSGT